MKVYYIFTILFFLFDVVLGGKFSDAVTAFKGNDVHEFCVPVVEFRKVERQTEIFREHLDRSIKDNAETQREITQLRVLLDAKDAEIQKLRGTLKDRLAYLESVIQYYKKQQESPMTPFMPTQQPQTDSAPPRTARLPSPFLRELRIPPRTPQESGNVHHQRHPPPQFATQGMSEPSGPPPTGPLPPVPPLRQARSRTFDNVPTLSAAPGGEQYKDSRRFVQEALRQNAPISSESAVFQQMLRAHKSHNDIRQRARPRAETNAPRPGEFF